MLSDKCVFCIYDDVIHCEAPLPNLSSDNIFYTLLGAKPPNLKTIDISGSTVC